MKTILPVLLFAGMAAGADEPAPAVSAPATVSKQAASKKSPSDMERIKYVLLARELLLEKYDANRDGVLDGQEKKNLLDDAAKKREEFRKNLFRRFDKDGDGKISKQEAEEMRTFLRKARQDRRASGVPALMPSPRQEAAKKTGEGEEKGRVSRRGGGSGVMPSVFMRMQSLIMEKYDANGNGRIDPEEAEKIREDAEELYNRKVAELLAKYDADGNGRIDPAEKETVRSGTQTDAANGEDETEELNFDEIDAFIKGRFEEELMEMLESGEG